MAIQNPCKAFISYSHDNAQHKLNVLELSNRLRTDGVDSMIDRYIDIPSQGWPRWMRKQIKDADAIIIVCSQNYCTRFYGEEKTGKGLGANWEGLIISEYFYESSTDLNQKLIIPVLFEEEDLNNIPIELKGFTYVRLPSGYEQLYRILTHQPEINVPPLGKVKKLNTAQELSQSEWKLNQLSISSSGATEIISDKE